MFDSSAGNTTTVYVIDSGCRTTHQDLGGRATTIANFVRGESVCCRPREGLYMSAWHINDA